MSENQDDVEKKRQEKEQRTFDMVLSQISNRETAMLTWASIASSASLVFLGFIGFSNCNNNCTEFSFLANNWWVGVLGIMFPILAFTSNEITRLLVHTKQQRWINKLTDTGCTIIKKGRIVRLVLNDIILLVPIIGWIIALSITFAGEYACFWIGFGLVSLTIAVSVLTHFGKPDKEKSEDCKTKTCD